MAGGVWNRAGRRSGGVRAHEFFAGARAGHVSLDLWIDSVNELVRTVTGKDATDLVPREDLVRWYDAGERNTWVASQVIEREKRPK